ncbi:MAG: hypothetical protein ACPHQD_13895, partial [Vibrio toranzoniae]
MNLYLCSTLRHFLFALLKSLKEVNQESRIIVVTDQQGLEPESFDLSILPSTITVKFTGRKKLLKEGLFDQELKKPIPYLPRIIG